MSKHTIERIEEEKLSISKVLAESHGLGGSKTLTAEFCSGSYTYSVTSGDNIEYKGHSAEKAVDVYNSIKHKQGKKTHTVENFSQHELVFNQTIASSFGKGNSKEINVKVENCVKTYELKNKGVVEYSGTSSMKVVDLYNEL